MLDAKEAKFADIGGSGTGFRLNEKLRSSVKKCDF